MRGIPLISGKCGATKSFETQGTSDFGRVSSQPDHLLRYMSLLGSMLDFVSGSLLVILITSVRHSGLVTLEPPGTSNRAVKVSGVLPYTCRST